MFLSVLMMYLFPTNNVIWRFIEAQLQRIFFLKLSCCVFFQVLLGYRRMKMKLAQREHVEQYTCPCTKQLPKS